MQQLKKELAGKFIDKFGAIQLKTGEPIPKIWIKRKILPFVLSCIDKAYRQGYREGLKDNSKEEL